MKRRILGILLSVSLLLNWTNVVRADEYTQCINKYGEPFLIESTAYSYGEITKDGSRVREGIIAAKEEWLGLGAIVYEVEPDGSIGDVRGFYEIKDTGSDYRLQNGTCIDFYMESYEDAVEYGRQNVYIQLIDAKG